MTNQVSLMQGPLENDEAGYCEARWLMTKRGKQRARPHHESPTRRQEGAFAFMLWLFATISQVLFFWGPRTLAHGGGHIHIRPVFGFMALASTVGALVQTWRWSREKHRNHPR